MFQIYNDLARSGDYLASFLVSAHSEVFQKVRKNVEFGLTRSLRGLCENKNFSSRTPARCEILTRNGLSSLARNIDVI